MPTKVIVSLAVALAVILISVELTLIASWMYGDAREDLWVLVFIAELLFINVIGNFALGYRRARVG